MSPNGDIELGRSCLGDRHNVSSCYGEYLCEAKSKSIHACGRCSPDTKLETNNVLAQTVTLTLRVGGWVMCITHHLVRENNCVK